VGPRRRRDVGTGAVYLSGGAKQVSRRALQRSPAFCHQSNPEILDSMDYVTLGRTGLRVSVAGLGCGGFSRLGLGTGKSEAEAIGLVRQALDLGINLLDTAAV